MDTVFVVMGTTGEYSDREEWPVMAYLNREKAREHVENASRPAKEIEATASHWYDVAPGLNEYDPNMKMDYTGTCYFLYKVPLKQ